MSAEKEREVQESEIKFVDHGLTPTPTPTNEEKNGSALGGDVIEASVEVKWVLVLHMTVIDM